MRLNLMGLNDFQPFQNYSSVGIGTETGCFMPIEDGREKLNIYPEINPIGSSRMVCIYIYTGWWFGCHEFYFPINIGLIIIPIDALIFFRGVAQPPTSIYIYIYIHIYIYIWAKYNDLTVLPHCDLMVNFWEIIPKWPKNSGE